MSEEEESSEAETPHRVDQAPTTSDHGVVVVGSEVVQTVVGPIHEWLPVEPNVPAAPTMAFFGKRRTGKSTTIKNVAYHLMQHIPFGIVMSNTSFTGDWETIVPKRLIVQGLRQDVIDWLIARQKKLVAKFGGDEKHPAVQAFIILDDGK